MAVPNREGARVVDSLGTRFRQERERQKITLDDVATSTKIGTRMLKALEDDHFDQLPGGIFNKGFVRAYARHLGMDEEQAITDYLAATGASQPIKEPEAVLSALAVRAEESRTTEPGAGDLPWDKLAAILLLAAFGLSLWGWRLRRQSHLESSQQSNPPAVTASPAPVAQPPVASGADTSAAATAATSPPSTSSITPPPPSPTEAQPAPPAAPGNFLLLIQARDDSWIEVSADGKDVTHELLPAGTQKSIQAQREIVIKAGNIGGLDFTFNGKKLPAQGAPDEVKTLKFAPSGLQVPTTAPQPAVNPA